MARVRRGGAVLIAGVDEAGRGPLAGPVCAAAVILDPQRPIVGVADSKTLSARRREALDVAIRAAALAWSLGWATAQEIDELNILHATMLAMRRAVRGLSLSPDRVLVDGNRCPALEVETEAIVGGDGLVAEIGAASILAKVARDRVMQALDEECPGYGFGQHKGYPTRAHLNALAARGPTAHHRLSFAPVRKAVDRFPRR